MVQQFAFLAELIPILEEVAPLIAAGGGIALLGALDAIGSEAGIDPTNPHTWLNGILNLQTDISQRLGEPMVEAFVKAPLGLLAGPHDEGTEAAFSLLSRAMGYGIYTPLVVAAFGGILKAAFAGRAPEHALEHLAKIPEELGTPFMLGEILHDLFFQAIGPSLEEAINQRWHPRRIDIQTARLLLRQHKINKPTWDKLADKLGYDAETKGYVEQLTNQPLALGELQQAYLYGLLGEGDIRERLNILGYDGGDIDTMVSLLLKRTETVGGDYYRTVARGAFLDGVITEGQFRGILKQTNVPDASIELELAGAHLELQVKRTTLSVSQLHAAYKAGDNSRGATRQALITHGYSSDDAELLLKTWDSEDAPKLKAFSEAQVLGYFEAQVLSRDAAYKLLVSEGLRADDANFLLDHPEARPKHVTPPVSERTILDAYTDDILTQDQAAGMLLDLGLTQQNVTLQIRIATFNKAKRKPKLKAPKEISEADLRDMYKNGLMTLRALTLNLQQLGYSEAAATAITTLEGVKLGTLIAASPEFITDLIA